MIIISEIIDRYEPKGNFPVRLGSALRVPSYAYRNWGIEGPEEVLRAYSDAAYQIEWKEGTPKQMEYVIEAAETAALGNCSAMLRDMQAKTIHSILLLPKMKKKRRVNYTEPGAGGSTVVLYQYLKDQGYDVQRIFSTLIEPSATRLRATAEKLEKMGLKEGKDFMCIEGKDSEIPLYVKNGSQDIVAANATIHHHAYQDRIFKIINDSLNEDGFLGIFDWYEGLCDHPARVYQALREHKFKDPIKWETKEEDLKRFVMMFPKSLEIPPFSSPENEMATRMITTYWLDGWAVARAKAIEAGTFDTRDDILMLEAHGLPEAQTAVLIQNGFTTSRDSTKSVIEAAGYNGNPHRILTRETMIKLGMDKKYGEIPEKGSNLLLATLVQKKI